MLWTSHSCSISGSAALGCAAFLAGCVSLLSLIFVSLFLVSLILAIVFLAFSMSSGVVELRNAMRLLSGDQIGSAAPLGRSVTIQASPPASDSIAICDGLGLPVSSLSPPRVNAMRLPSGDQRGCVSCLPFVIRTGGSLPEVAAIQIDVS